MVATRRQKAKKEAITRIKKEKHWLRRQEAYFKRPGGMWVSLQRACGCTTEGTGHNFCCRLPAFQATQVNQCLGLAPSRHISACTKKTRDSRGGQQYMMKDRIGGHSRGPRCCRSARRGVRVGWLCNGGWIDFKSEEAGWLMVHGVVSWAGHASRCGKTHESYCTRGATSMRRWVRVGGWSVGGPAGLHHWVWVLGQQQDLRECLCMSGYGTVQVSKEAGPAAPFLGTHSWG